MSSRGYSPVVCSIDVQPSLQKTLIAFGHCRLAARVSWLHMHALDKVMAEDVHELSADVRSSNKLALKSVSGAVWRAGQLTVPSAGTIAIRAAMIDLDFIPNGARLGITAWRWCRRRRCAAAGAWRASSCAATRWRACIRTHSTTCRTSPRCQYHHTHPRPETQPASAPISARTRPPAAPHHAVSTTTHTHAPRHNPLARLHPHALDHLPHLTTLSRAYIRTHSATCRTSPRCQYHHTHPRPETQPASAPTSARTRPPAAPHHAVSTTTHTHAPRHNPLARLYPHALDHLPHLTTLSVPPHTPTPRDTTR
ncbi:hypothetical protein ACJJTC_000062 [Scirpophaga incertulas]